MTDPDRHEVYFEFVAIGRLTVLAKQIIAAYYGKPPAHSYYVGCSTGGREAMLMSQRYPLYFDGIVVGSPAMRTGHSNLATRTVTVALNSVAPKDANGRPAPALSQTPCGEQSISNWGLAPTATALPSACK